MKSRILVFTTIFFGAIFFASFTSTNNSGKVQEQIILKGDTVTTGQELFRLNCAGCHGINREGNPPSFPSLTGIEEKMTVGEIKAQIKNGKGLMPPMAHLSDKEIDVITRYLFNEDEQINTIASLTPEVQGEMLFKSNCAGCHRATATDPKPQNAGTQMCSMMEPAILAGTAQRFSKDEFFNILETGPCYMPTFSHLKKEDKEALFVYLKTLEGEAGSGQPNMGKKHKRVRKGKSCCGM
jgi:mono/diheme cytochrome c family protein